MKLYNNHLNKINELKQQMNASHEWAITSNETKTLAQERIRILEQQIPKRSVRNHVSKYCIGIFVSN